MGQDISEPTDVAKLRNDTVFDGVITASGVWQDLDLSAYVGANSALCFFEITTSNSGNDFYMKPKGYGGAVANHVLDGVCADDSVVDKYVYLICFTNNDGLIEIACIGTNRDYVIKLVGLIK